MISTKDIPSGNGKTPKTLQPGNTTLKVNSIYLDTVPWSDEEYNVMLDCEGAELGEDFEGFYIDKNQESLGRHKGQVGRVRSSQWTYANKQLPGGIEILRDVEITKFLKNLAIATDCVDWLEAEDGKHETIESLVQEMNDKAPFADKYLNVCLGGREYENKSGYTNYDLFLPKFSKQGVPFEADGTNSGRVYTFNDSEHIAKKKVKEVEDFTAEGKEDFTV
jgi:hypothetical protein